MINRDGYAKRWQRIEAAVALENTDRVPVVLEYAGFAAYVTQTPMARFLSSLKQATRVMIDAYRLIAESAEADAVNYGTFNPYVLCGLFACKVRVPGVELPDDDMWQVVEEELMTVDDYDRILDEGWPSWWRRFMKERIIDDAAENLLPWNLEPLDIRAAWKDEVGLPVISGGDVTTPFELLCGGRSLQRFFMDLFDQGDRIEAAMNEIAPHLAASTIQSALKRGYPCVWVGGWRTAPAMLSPKMWDRFAWPYMRQLVQQVTDAGLIALLHLDANWTRELHRFRELPTRRCIVALDGETDIYRAKEVLGDHLCIMGDVPATMLYLDDPDTVYEYCRRLIRDLGPTGFILHSGCDIPTNAKLENVQAMVSAVHDG